MKKKPVIVLFSVVVVLALFFMLCTFVKRPYEKVLLDRFGTLIPEEGQTRLFYQWYFKLPWDSVQRFDQRLHLYPGMLQQVSTSTSATISVQTFAAWRIVDPVEFYRKTGGSDEEATKRIAARIQALVGEKFGQRNLNEFFNSGSAAGSQPATAPATAPELQNAKLEALIADLATNGDGKELGLKLVGIEIVQVGFSRIAFPPSNTGAVYDRMVQALNQKSIQLVAEGNADAQTIRTQGLRDAQATIQQAGVQAQGIRGEADQEAYRILASVQKTAPAREFFQLWKGLEFVKSSFAKNTIMVLSADSPILFNLFKGTMTQPGQTLTEELPMPRPVVPSTTGPSGRQ